jgi:hypothetical protein
MNGQEWCPRCQKFVSVRVETKQFFLDQIETTHCRECGMTIRSAVK